MAEKTHAHRIPGSRLASRRRLGLFGYSWLTVAAACLGLIGERAFAQDQPTTSKGTSHRVITTSDGWQLQITYYSPGTGEETPVVVLLHREGEGGSRLVWKNGFADQLWNAGYAVVAVDLRKHGESKPIATRTDAGRRASRRRAASTSRLRPDDYRQMVTEDLEAVKQFIYEEHQNKQINMNKMAIVAPEMSAAVAIFFTLMDWQKQPYNDAPTKEASTPRGQDVRALVLLSPQSRVPGLQTGPAVLQLRRPDWNIATLILYGALDDATAGDAEGIYKKLVSIAGNEERTYLKSYPYKLRGTDLLGKQDINVEELILRFLEKHLKELPGEWRNRKSRLER